MTPYIIDIQHFCLNDGEGIRTTIFLKGCPLRCLWCHNPESQSFKKELSFLKEQCISCKQCQSVCVNSVHSFVANQHQISFDRCKACGNCVTVCPSSSLEMTGKIWSIPEVVEEVVKDNAFYGTSGGVTFSGGEPLLHTEWIILLVRELKKEGINITIETSGYVASEHIVKLVPFIDHWLFDYKAGSSQKHKQLCGVENKLIHDNFKLLYEKGCAITVRYPLIPTINDSEEDFLVLVELLKETSPSIPVQFMPYHVLGKSKADRIGKEYSILLPTEDASEEYVQQKYEMLQRLY